MPSKPDWQNDHTVTVLVKRYPFEKSKMGNALSLAILVHLLIILGIGFKMEATDAPAPTVEVTLARHPSRTPPDESDYIAQFDQEGSGTDEKKKELTADRIPPIESTVFRDTDPLQPLAEQAQRESPVEQQIISANAESATIRDQAEEEFREGNVSTKPQTIKEVASLRAKLAQQRQFYSKIPRKLVLTAASAKASGHAEYLRQWIEWVENVGNENYPEEARRKQIYGAIRLAVALDRQGNVASIEILSSSGQRVLDQAAIRIVRLAAPFAPIPSSIREDQVEVIRTWNFIPGDQFHTSAQ